MSDHGCDRCDEQIGCSSDGLNWLCAYCMELKERVEEHNADWQECWNCSDGFTGHDCGEDCCACLEPEDNVICDICDGDGGWERKETNENKGSRSVRVDEQKRVGESSKG